MENNENAVEYFPTVWEALKCFLRLIKDAIWKKKNKMI